MVRKCLEDERTVRRHLEISYLFLHHRLRAASAQDSLKLCLVVGILDSNSKDAERPSGRALEDDDDDSMQRRRSVW